MPLFSNSSMSKASSLELRPSRSSKRAYYCPNPIKHHNKSWIVLPKQAQSSDLPKQQSHKKVNSLKLIFVDMRETEMPRICTESNIEFKFSSNFMASASCIPGTTWLYVSRVIEIDECPKHSCTTFGCTQAFNKSVAWICRASWNVIIVMAAFLQPACRADLGRHGWRCCTGRIGCSSRAGFAWARRSLPDSRTYHQNDLKSAEGAGDEQEVLRYDIIGWISTSGK